ncbi:MAG TPA: FecR domain-containing protein [Myxococcus sp.]|nr:FecR domain-containing protein [Myxococcus sp.]
MARHEVQALWALAAGELASGERLRVETHLAGCEACALELTRMRQSRALLHEARAVEPDVRWDAVGARLRSAATEKLARREPRPRWPWALALAGACAAMLALWVLTPRQVAREDAVAVSPSGTESPGTVEAVATTQAESAAEAVLRDAAGAERRLEPGMQLRSGVAVRTPGRASALLRLPDASRVRLSAGSEVELSRAEARQVHLTVKQGRLSVQASHAERRGFLVEAAGLHVSVVGTVFTVERTAQGAAVAVAEGRVRVEVEGQPPRLVSAGERVELSAEGNTLRHQPLSEPDQRAFEELAAPAPAPGQTVPTGTGLDAKETVVPAVAHVPQAPASVKPAVGTPDSVQPGRSQVASTFPRGKAPTRKEQPVEPPARPEETPASGGAVAAEVKAPPPADPSQEFAPYPAPSVAESLPAQPPEPATVVAEKPEPKKKEPLLPVALVSRDADERFLGYARMQVEGRSCDRLLSSLEEIAQRSPRTDHREQARYLRARCYEEKLQPQSAQGEYRQYLREFPRGRYAREARTALLP